MIESIAGRDAGAERLLTVSNRGPVEHLLDETDSVLAVPGQGGLANALRVAARFRPTTWLCSPMTDVDRMIAAGQKGPVPGDGNTHFVPTDARAYDLFYGTYSNEVLWFLQHSLAWPEDLDVASRRKAWSEGYVAVNRAFAEAVNDELGHNHVRAVVFHDYHFYMAPGMVRARNPRVYLQHFVHIPWPEAGEWKRLEPDILAALCQGLLGNDSVVFQTAESVRNFLLTCEAALPSARVNPQAGTVTLHGRTTRVWANAISVDPDELDNAAVSAEFSRYRWLLRPAPRQKLIVRVDRLDPTKNVLRGFEAYRLLLERYPELREHVQFLAVLVPSKTDIQCYHKYQEQTLDLIGRINRDFGNHHWKPIRTIYEHNRMQALAAMSLYDVLLVNSVADGMNLVAKEGPLLNTHDGVVVLSRNAGAYQELSSAAIGIDPLDVEETAEAMFRGLELPPDRRRDRAARMRAMIRRHDLRDWFQALAEDIDRNAKVGAISAA